MAPLAGGLIVLALVASAFAFVQTLRHYSAATREYPWLHWAEDRLTVADRFRFAFSSSADIATALAPAAVAGIDALPLRFTAESTPSDGVKLINSLNNINDACAMSTVTLAPCGEGAVARRHARLEQSLASVPLKEDYWIERKGTALSFLRLLQTSVKLCGLTPYRTETALLVRPVDGYGGNGVTGWKSLAPGDCEEVSFGKYRHAPKIYAHSRAADSDAISLLREDAHYAATWEGRGVAWGGSGPDSERSCAGTGGDQLQAARCGVFDEPLGFRAVDTSTSPGMAQGTWLIADPGLCAPNCAWNQTKEGLPIAGLQRGAASLASLLAMRKAYRAQYGTVQPYVNGIEVVDDNGQYREGVRVTAAAAQTPFGVESPFEVGDVITELAGIPIFSGEDLKLALARFITTTGADKTYRYQYWRYDPTRGEAVKYEATGTAYFDPDYWLDHGYSGSEVRAMVEGALNALSFGWYRWFGCAVKRVFQVVPSFTACNVAAANEWMLMRQLFPDYYSWGGVPSMLISPIRIILSVANIAVSATAGLVIELLESGMSVAAEMAPGQGIEVTAQQFAASVVQGRLAAFGTALVKPGL
ncbi:hypothetical protein ACCC88_13125 [Sphingomonas sp. Sphisp140]|uniref:hypothetical protein n=1 Tax=unclassified Sphingomonas TaxID=196159 RepID=UPI0039AEA813